MTRNPVLCLLFIWGLLLSACHDPAPKFHDTGFPERLSDWQVLSVDDRSLQPNLGVIPYDLNTPLFTDYAHKYRTIWMPEGVSAKYSETDVFDFPVGTIISKTFLYPVHGNSENQVLRTDDTSKNFFGDGLDLDGVKLIETRILAKREEGWIALPYVWNDEETEATLKRTGDIIPLEISDASGASSKFPYVVPNTNQCAGCHATNATTRALQPIGLTARHLNKTYPYIDGPFSDTDGPQNQLIKLYDENYLSGLPEKSDLPKSAKWNDEYAAIDDRARAYLDINCAHCHNKVGPADTSGLHFEPETAFGPHLGICKISIAAGAGTGGRAFDIVPGKPDASIMTFRLDSKDPAIMMPELGRSTIHREGVELLEQWIAQMQGDCGRPSSAK